MNLSSPEALKTRILHKEVCIMAMRKLVAVILGIILILLSPLLGRCLANIYLSILGSTATEIFAAMIEGCIHGFQLIGALSVLYGILPPRNRS